ncbi:hypothetical protein [Shewanella marisflavi]|uniref:Flagellar hook-length control protein FliK n=1 Tax=Shewanella marisflavi TaxID=260364 RepID=A0AAC9U136_9GAMM|nr:hypothetical protein [Shewanella marisflavi]ASJ97339.1 hypothetical protein CFF01_12535 [Shewanella marisflavi]
MTHNRIDLPTANGLAAKASPVPAAKVEAQNIPVEILPSPAGDRLRLNGRELLITYIDAKDQQRLSQDAIRLTVLTQLSAAANSTSQFSGQVMALGEPQTMTIPKGLLAYIHGNQISLEQLTAFASRPQGYPLGEVQVSANNLYFNESQLVRLMGAQLPAGQYIAKIELHQGQLALTLTPKLAQANLQLSATSALVTNTATATSAQAIESLLTQTLVSKPELASAYQVLTQKLSGQALGREMYQALARELSSIKTTTALQPPAVESVKQGVQQSLPPLVEKPLINKQPDSSPQTLGPASNQAPSKRDILGLTALAKMPINGPDSALRLSETRINTLALANVSELRQSLLFKQIASMQTGIKLQTDLTSQQGAGMKANLGQNANLTSQQAVGIKQSQADMSLNQLGLNDKGLNDRGLNHRGLNLALGQLADKALVAQKAMGGKLSLLNLMQQMLPLAFPRPLSQLASPSFLKQELVDSLAGITNGAAPVSSLSSISSHAGTIGVLFQLLLGRQVQTNTSAKTPASLQGLQKLASGSQLLGILEKAGGLELMGKLLSNFSLYQQASSDTPQSTNWYFTLPYMIEHRHEELEGHFEQEQQDKDTQTRWRLQLKFNLSDASLLINAEVKQGRLNLGFTSESQTLLDSIGKRLTALEQKIIAIGLTPEHIHTKASQVPASLLPGDHYLVKVKA